MNQLFLLKWVGLTTGPQFPVGTVVYAHGNDGTDQYFLVGHPVQEIHTTLALVGMSMSNPNAAAPYLCLLGEYGETSQQALRRLMRTLRETLRME